MLENRLLVVDCLKSNSTYLFVYELRVIKISTLYFLQVCIVRNIVAKKVSLSFTIWFLIILLHDSGIYWKQCAGSFLLTWFMKTIETPANSPVSTCLMPSTFLSAILSTSISLRWLPDKNSNFQSPVSFQLLFVMVKCQLKRRKRGGKKKAGKKKQDPIPFSLWKWKSIGLSWIDFCTCTKWIDIFLKWYNLEFFLELCDNIWNAYINFVVNMRQQVVYKIN